MNAIQLAPVFVVGLLGSVHCIGMCGGIVAALSQAPPRPFPVAVITAGAPAAALESAARTLAYNAGRIGSYAMAGAIAGGAFGGLRTLAQAAALQQGAYILANVMLVLLGLYLAGLSQAVARIERIGLPLWRRIEPVARRITPMGSASRLLALGALWGWLPCGMVYSMLLMAAGAGSAGAGAATMAAFGLGTLPVLLAAGMAGARLRTELQKPRVRMAGGLVVLAFGLLGLARGATGLPPVLAAVCIGSPA
jgi:hypothetical protein